MALQTSGAISLNDIHVEAGGTTGTQVSINDTDVRALIGSTAGTQIDFDDFYGASSSVTLTSAGQVNGEDQRQEITVSSFISSGGTLIIPSNIWVWSDNTATAALTIDIPCTIENSGKIIGKGGNGGRGTIYGTATAGAAGGPAIKINSSVSGVTITNNSGGYIAGGGGGGGANYRNNYSAGGGGGAGGGTGGLISTSNSYYGSVGTGGSLNASGSNAAPATFPYSSNGFTARGGGAGGGGGGLDDSGSDKWHGYGGGGGRQLPGSAGEQYTPYVSGSYAGSYVPGGYYGGRGGGAGNVGQSRSPGGGGGGGWGARGGSGGSSTYGSGGSAIDDSGNTYTLTNNGTVYGGT